MLKYLHLTAVFSAVLLPLFGDSHHPAIAQERQGCFMYTAAGELIDLSYICPSPERVVEVQSQTLGTGDIQVTLRWTSTDDLDLAVNDPAGETVAFFNRSVPSGGQLDVDANAACSGTTSSPIENIFWPPSQAPQGQYTIEIDLFSRCEPGNAPVPFTLTLLVQGTTETFEGTLSDQNPTVSYPFSLPR